MVVRLRLQLCPLPLSLNPLDLRFPGYMVLGSTRLRLCRPLPGQPFPLGRARDHGCYALSAGRGRVLPSEPRLRRLRELI